MAAEPSSESPSQKKKTETEEANHITPLPPPKMERTPPSAPSRSFSHDDATHDRITLSSAVPAKGTEAKSSAPETLAAPDREGGECRSFSQLLAGAMASPVGNSRAVPILAVPMDAVRLPVVAVPCFIGPAALLDSSVSLAGQFAMTHQAVLATVTAQAQMQLQGGYTSQAMISTIGPLPLQQKSPPASEDNALSPEAEQLHPSNQKPAQIAMKMTSDDGFNWRKYGQKQVKSSESSRSYYKCTQASCYAKKKVERCQDGRVVEIIYRGEHNHKPPQKIKCSKERGPLCSGVSREIETLSLPSGDVNGLESCPSKMEQTSGDETPEQQLHCSSDCEGNTGIKTEEDPGDEPEPKRRLIESSKTCSAAPLKTVREPKIVVQTASDLGLVSDGFRWRKYGQKNVKGNPNPRSYYKCTQIGCPVRKHVERDSADIKSIITTYEGKHNHDLPTPKSSSNPPVTALLIASAAPTDDGLNEQSKISDSLVDKQQRSESQTVDAEALGDKALELGGDRALESAETLLSIGFNATSEKDAGGNNADVIQRPLFNENRTVVPVQNS